MTENSKTDQPAPIADLSGAPLPTQAMLKKRQSLLWQPVRFAAFNLRMLQMVTKGHSQH